MSIEVAIICDRCARLIDAGKSARAARASIKESGGKVSLPGGKDLCMWCVADGLTIEPKPNDSESEETAK